jgi:hypothetical protein
MALMGALVSRLGPPPSVGNRRAYITEFEDGSELLVEEWWDETGERTVFTAATRPEHRAVWGPPHPLERAP